MIRALVLFAALSNADDKLLEPADYLEIMEASKLRYNIVSEPSKNAVEEMECPRRDERTRLVTTKDEKTLVTWEITAEATKLLQEGETLFQQHRYEAAAEKYKAAIAADPQSASAHFFYGDALLFGPKKDAASALEQYKKGIALDPTLPSGHFFASSAYARLGRRKEAREELIQALTFYPGYETIWKIGTQTPDFWDIQPMVRRAFEPPKGYIGKKTEEGIDVFIGANGEWLGYAMCKAVRANEPRFQEAGAEGGWSLEVERECVLNQLMTTYNTTQAKLEEQAKAKGIEKPAIDENDIIAALPARERSIFDVSRAELLDGFVLFEIIGRRCPLALAMLQNDVQQVLEAYIRKYVIVAKE